MTLRHEAQAASGLRLGFSAEAAAEFGALFFPIRNGPRIAKRVISAPDVVDEGAAWRDVERDYAAFNQRRTWFLARAGCDPLPSSTAIQARPCRSGLLVEIEAIAALPG